MKTQKEDIITIKSNHHRGVWSTLMGTLASLGDVRLCRLKKRYTGGIPHVKANPTMPRAEKP